MSLSLLTGTPRLKTNHEPRLHVWPVLAPGCCTAGPAGPRVLKAVNTSCGEWLPHTALHCLPDFPDGDNAHPETGKTPEALCRTIRWAALTPAGPGAGGFWSIPLAEVLTANTCRISGARVCVCILLPPFISHMTPRKLLNLFVPQFPYLSLEIRM